MPSGEKRNFVTFAEDMNAELRFPGLPTVVGDEE
jgi:hypothetical protein